MSNDFKVKGVTHPQHLSMISDSLDKIISQYNNGEITTTRCYTMERSRGVKNFKIEAYLEEHTNELTFKCIY